MIKHCMRRSAFLSLICKRNARTITVDKSSKASTVQSNPTDQSYSKGKGDNDADNLEKDLGETLNPEDATNLTEDVSKSKGVDPQNIQQRARPQPNTQGL